MVQELEDGTTKLHLQLPLAFQEAVLQKLPELTKHPELLEAVLQASAATQKAQQVQLAQQQGEIAELRRQQGEIAELRQQVQALQGGLAAVLQQQKQG